jgi:hypothetical protein
MFKVSAFVTAIKEFPVCGVDGGALGPAEADTCLGNLAPLLPNFFALVLG